MLIVIFWLLAMCCTNFSTFDKRQVKLRDKCGGCAISVGIQSYSLLLILRTWEFINIVLHKDAFWGPMLMIKCFKLFFINDKYQVFIGIFKYVLQIIFYWIFYFDYSYLYVATVEWINDVLFFLYQAYSF